MAEEATAMEGGGGEGGGEGAASACKDESPLTTRLESKAWKTRMEAYIELAEMLNGVEEGDACVEDYGPVVSKAVADSNVNAQDKGIDAAISFVKKASAQLLSRHAANIISKVVEKAFVQAKCKAKGQELSLSLIEADCGEVVTDELIKGCSNKQPKISGAAAECLRMAVQSFGLRALGPQSKAVVKLSVTLFDSTVAAVRGEALPLAVELHKYMGAALRPSYDNLRPAQQKEMDEAFASAGPPQPTRETRSSASKNALASSQSAPASSIDQASAAPASSAAADVDPMDFFDPVEILSKLPNGWCEKVLAAPKWQEKKELIDGLIELASAPKLASGDYFEVVKTLKRLANDSMVVVVSTAVIAVGLLARGLRKEFSQGGRLIFSTLLDRLKEKDNRVKESLHSTLDSLTGKCLSLADVMDDLCTALGPKGNPKSKVEILKYLKRAADGKSSSIQPKNLKPLIELLIKSVDDSAADIREASCAVLASFIQVCGMPSMKGFLEALDEKKKKKIESLVEGSGPSEAPQPPAPAAVRKSTTSIKSETSSAPKEPASVKPAAKKVKVAAAPKLASAKEASNGKDSSESDVTTGTPVEQLDAMVEEMVSQEIRTKLTSANWKERLEGAEALEADVREKSREYQIASGEAVVRLLSKTFVEKKETNFQVMAKAFAVVQSIAELSPKMSKRSAFWFIPMLLEKLGDVKLKGPASDCLFAMAEAVSPQFVLNQAYEVLPKQKNPKVLENSISLVNSMVSDFGLKVIKPKPLLDFVKSMLDQTNPATKKAAVELVVTMRKHLGPDLRNMLTDLKPALLTTIDEAFAKIQDAEVVALAPKRQVKCEDEAAAAAAGPEGELVNLTGPIGAHLKGLADANWKERQAAITAIDELVTQAKPLGCTGAYMEGQCGEMWAAMKARLKDTNKNLSIQVLALLAKVADAVGAPVDKYSKHIFPNMLSLISDNKKTVRDAVLHCLDAWSRHVSTETIIKYLPVALSVDAPAGREDAVKWSADYLSRVRKADEADLSPILPAVMDCLMHRVAEVRGGAEKCLVAIYVSGGRELVNRALRDMKPAQLKGIKPLCDKAEKTAMALTSGRDAEPPVEQKREEFEAKAASEDSSQTATTKKVVKTVESSSEAVEVAPNEEAAEKPLLRCNNGKEARYKKYGKAKWILDDAKEIDSLISMVGEQMWAVASEELHGKLFSKDFKKQVDGMKELTSFVQEHHQPLMDNLDVLLKMCSLRMVAKGSNTSVLLGVLDLLKHSMEQLVVHNHCLDDTEAQVILPVLMEEVGSNSDVIRKSVRELLKKATQVYPASKIFSFALDSAQNTRNQRSRAEILSEMSALIERLGLEQVCTPSKALTAIASFISERDPLVRNAACDCIAAAYTSMGDKVWKYLSRMEGKEKDMLETRLKKAKPPQTSELPRPTASAELRRSMPEGPSEKLTVARSSVPGLEASSFVPTPIKSKESISELLEAPTPTISNIRSRFQASEVKAGGKGDGEGEDVVACLAQLSSPSALQQIEGLKKLTAAMEPSGSRAAAAVNSRADEVVVALRGLIASGLESDLKDENVFRVVKYSLNAAHVLFTDPSEGSRYVKDSTLGSLIEELLLRLHEQKFQRDEAYEVLMKGMNELMMNILHNANANHVFTVLIRFLYEGAPLSGGREVTAEFTDGVLRCLLEMARKMQTFAPRLDIDMLLYDAHMFLVAHPPSKYRGREFRPLRLLKTILNELVKLKGEGIRMHLSLVPVESKPTLCSYLELVLQQHASKAGGGKTSGGEDISAIFDKIGSRDKDVAKEGFKLLYLYKLNHSDFSLDQYLSGRSPQFQEHVHKNLAKVQAQHEATSSSNMPLQSAMSMANKGMTPLDLKPSGAGALLDKLQGIRSQLGIGGVGQEAEGAEEKAAEEAREEEKEVRSSVTSSSVVSLQERLAKLRS